MAAILEFPYSAASHPQRPPVPISATVIPFPVASESLTKRELALLLPLIGTAGHDWVCEPERDGNSNLSVLIANGDPESGSYAAYLVCRRESRLHLIDARLAARWGTLGVFSHMEDLVLAVAKLIYR